MRKYFPYRKRGRTDNTSGHKMQHTNIFGYKNILKIFSEISLSRLCYASGYTRAEGVRGDENPVLVSSEGV